MINWIIFILASIGLIAVGALSGKKIESSQKDGDGFLLGAKQVGAFVGAGTLMATGYSGWGFIGAPGTAYAFGTIEVLANFFFAPGIVFGTLLFAGFMAKQADKSGGLTVPEYMAVTHRGTDKQKRLVHFVGGLATFVFLSVYIIGQVRAVGLVAAEWLGISEMVASAILMLVVVIFTMQGGLLAVAITDTIMCMGMLIASVIIFITIIRDIPMLDLITEVGKIKGEFINPTTSAPYGGAKYSVFLVMVYTLLFTTTLPYMSVRFLSFKEDIKIHNVALIMAPMGIILSLIPITGIYMYYKNPGLVNPDSAMPVFLNTFLSPALAGMITLFILFAMLSTISSVLQSLASALSYDMLVSISGKKSDKGDLYNRIGVLVTAVWAMFLTFAAPQGMLNQIAYIGTGGLISAFVGPTIMRAFIEADLKACFASMITGFIVNIYLVFVLNVGWVEAPIIAGAAGSIVYAIMGLIANGGSRKYKGVEVANN